MRAQCVAGHVAMPAASSSRHQQMATLPSASEARTRVRYIKHPQLQDKTLFLYMTRPPAHIKAATNVEADEVPVRLTDLRTAEPTTLQRHGFELVKFPSGKNLDWSNTQQVRHASGF